jgi:hypothetical protein
MVWVMQIISLASITEFAPEYDLFDVLPVPSDYLLELGACKPLLISSNKLVWGKGLFLAFRRLKIQNAVCVEVDEKLEVRLFMAISTEGRRDGYTWHERERIFCYMKKIGIDSNWEKDISSLIDSRKDFFSVMEHYCSLCPVLKKMVRENQIDMKSALAASGLPDSALALLYYYPKKLSFSERRLLLTNLSDICKRDALQREEVESLFQQVLSSKNPILSASEKRFPTLSAMQKEFRIKRDEVFAGSGINFSAPENFEGDNFGISFRVATEKQFMRRIDSLKNAEKRINEFFDILK